MSRRVLVIGGGAAGYFAAIRARELNPRVEVVLAEAGAKTLRKVAISGGGRCNVTHACFDTKEFARSYPRGSRELLGPFSKFQAKDTVEWFETRGVPLHTEADGRIFPQTNNSETIIHCLEQERIRSGVELRLKSKVVGIEVSGERYRVSFSPHSNLSEEFVAVLIATGSAPQGYALARSLGHRIEECVPSLFSFVLSDSRLTALSGVSGAASLRMSVGPKHYFEQEGPVLITHWGMSGPAVIKLSAWAARELAAANYQARLVVNWLPESEQVGVTSLLRAYKEKHPKQKAASNPAVNLPKRLWASLARAADIDDETEWGQLKKIQLSALEHELSAGEYQVCGKGEFKEEFVTCGGVSLKEINFQSMESKFHSGLFFAGEVLDIDGITGGFNFQSAWTSGWLAGGGLAGGRDTGSILD